MDVLLVRPPRRNSRDAGLCVPPMGLAYVAGALRRAGHDVEILDALQHIGERLAHRLTLQVMPTGGGARPGREQRERSALLHADELTEELVNIGSKSGQVFEHGQRGGGHGYLQESCSGST